MKQTHSIRCFENRHNFDTLDHALCEQNNRVLYYEIPTGDQSDIWAKYGIAVGMCECPCHDIPSRMPRGFQRLRLLRG